MTSDRHDETGVARFGLKMEPGPDLAVIVPTKNEQRNIAALYERLCKLLDGYNWEVIFVDDDSSDGTPEAIRRLAAADRRVRLIHRIARRGLSSACIEGMQASTARFVAVMDADMQHDEALLPRMVDMLRSQPLDVIVGSRYAQGGGVGAWERHRALISKIGSRLVRHALHTPISDPMSGFFVIRREAIDACLRNLSGIGFKILADLLASSPRPLRAKEVPYVFRPRNAGTSKLEPFVVWEFLVLLLDKLIGRIIPVRFVLFSIVGGIGVFAHLATLWLMLALTEFPFSVSQTVATGVAMTGNFTLNNWLTYRDQRLYRWNFVKGLISFAIICSFGAIANVGIASFLHTEQQSRWWMAGIAGAAISAVWNYAVSSTVTWRRS